MLNFRLHQPESNRQVSIPFKRESLSKVEYPIYLSEPRISFQFPSNGKAYPKSKAARVDAPARYVSIPFKRESLSKVYLFRQPNCTHLYVSIPFKRESLSKEQHTPVQPVHAIEFQFPSNGNAYPKIIVKPIINYTLL